MHYLEWKYPYSLVSSQEVPALHTFTFVCCVTPYRALLQQEAQTSADEAKDLNVHNMPGSISEHNTLVD